MACLITAGRSEPCKDTLAGLRNVYFINYTISPTDIYKNVEAEWVIDTSIGELIELINDVNYLYKFELKSNENVFDQEIVTSRENGTTFFRQTLTIKLKKQDIVTHNAIKTLAHSRPHILVENNEGQFFLVGMFRGCDLTAGSINSGGSLSDFSGYSMTFQAEEILPSPFVDNGTDSFVYTISPWVQSVIVTS